MGAARHLPENTIHMLRAMADLADKGHIFPHERAKMRWANGASPEGLLVDATERFEARREAVEEEAMWDPFPSGDEVQGALF